MYKAPLAGHTFTTDAEEVHAYIVRFTSLNKVAEAKMVAHAAEKMVVLTSWRSRITMKALVCTR